MPRIARIVIPGIPHHITQRGNNGQDVFFADEDRAAYVGTLQTQSARFGFAVEGFCLMTNHIHIVGTPQKEDSLALAIGRTDFIYTQYINDLHDRSGHLWQNRFYSCPMDDHHFFAALRYIETNPLRAGLSRSPWRYHWSSAGAHCGVSKVPDILDLARWRKGFSEEEWKEFVIEGTDEEEKLLRRFTRTGRPLGSDAFVARIEAALGCRLRALPVGRPRKKTKK